MDEFTQAPRAIYQPFSWLAPHPKHDAGAEFVALTMDVCHGLSTCLELVKSCNIDRVNHAHPLLSPSDSDHLMRLATAAVSLLAGAAESHIEWVNLKRAQVPS
jgi:hypothetical protein